MTYRSYRLLLQRPLAEYLPMQLLMVCCVGVVVLAALLEPQNELSEKKLKASVPLPLKDVKQKPFLTW